MPKLKRASSSLLSSRAKKRKKKQKEDPVQCQQQRERDRLRYEAHSSRRAQPRSEETQEATDISRRQRARRHVRQQNPQRRLLEQERDTAAHRWVRLENPIRRTEEQERDTAAHRRVRLNNLHQRTEEQIRNTAAHRVSRENPDIRRQEQQRDLQQHRVARSDPQYRAQEQINNARRQQVRDSRQASFRALNYNADSFYNTTDVGTLSVQCSNCGAIKFPMETESLCCLKGSVQLDAFPHPPVFLQHLYEGVDSNGKHFLANIRKYNCAFQMTSFGCSEITMAGFNPSFRIQGQVYHLIGSIVPAEGESPKFA